MKGRAAGSPLANTIKCARDFARYRGVNELSIQLDGADGREGTPAPAAKPAQPAVMPRRPAAPPVVARRTGEADDDALVLDHALPDYLVAEETSPGKRAEALLAKPGKPAVASPRDRKPTPTPPPADPPPPAWLRPPLSEAPCARAPLSAAAR